MGSLMLTWVSLSNPVVVRLFNPALVVPLLNLQPSFSSL
jgi:hypothetical protein